MLDEIKLEKLRVGYEMALSRHLYDANVEIDRLFDRDVVRITGSLLKLGKGTSIDIKYPDNWWQAFKERWFPKWALEKWPVKYKVHHIRAEAILPEARKFIEFRKSVGPYYLTLFENSYIDNNAS